MSLEWDILDATATDSTVIAFLFAQSWTSPFSQLQFGRIDPSTLATAMASQIEQQIKNPSSRFLVARHSETRQIAAVAQWAVHLEDIGAGMLETQQEIDERQRFDDELLRSKLPESSNHALIMEFTVGMRELRQQILQGRKHYLLENLVTHPEYRGKGLAGRLVQWVFPSADKDDLLVYLETASDNPAMRLYKKLGFEEQGHHTIEDLSKFAGKAELEACGSEAFHTHVAFIRYPHSTSEAGAVPVTR